MKKKLVTSCLVVALLAIGVIGGSLAYFTDTDKADNVFTVGNVGIDLTEPKWDEQGKVDAPEAYPGEALAKDPTVTNDGKNPCFVRIKVEGWDCLAPAGNITYRTDYVDEKLGTDWVKGTDGYFYYTKVLEVGATTDALFDQIVMPTDLTNGYDGSYDLVVTAEAVQAQGAKASFGVAPGEPGYDPDKDTVWNMDVTEIAAWFATCGMNK